MAASKMAILAFQAPSTIDTLKYLYGFREGGGRGGPVPPHEHPGQPLSNTPGRDARQPGGAQKLMRAACNESGHARRLRASQACGLVPLAAIRAARPMARLQSVICVSS